MAWRWRPPYNFGHFPTPIIFRPVLQIYHRECDINIKGYLVTIVGIGIDPDGYVSYLGIIPPNTKSLCDFWSRPEVTKWFCVRGYNPQIWDVAIWINADTNYCDQIALDIYVTLSVIYLQHRPENDRCRKMSKIIWGSPTPCHSPPLVYIRLRKISKKPM